MTADFEETILLCDGIQLSYTDDAAAATLPRRSKSGREATRESGHTADHEATRESGHTADHEATRESGHTADHEATRRTIQIHYCHAGQAVWNTEPGKNVFLNPGDFSVHSLRACPDSALIFPDGRYQGVTIFVDLQKLSAHPPELLAGTADLGSLLYEKFRGGNEVSFFAGNEQSETIFSGFYGQPEELALPYRRIKALELLLYLARIEMNEKNYLAEYPPEQIEIIRRIHDAFLQNMERRITIEELSRQYLINPTTLKAAFKTVYGTSLAAHMKKHRMEQAAKLLRETRMSIAGVAAAVGYESQSKFTTAFKNQFSVLPSAYRKSGGNGRSS